MKKNKKVKESSKLALKKGTDAGKKIIKTKLLIVTAVILFVITVGIIVVNVLPLYPIFNGDNGGDVPPTAPTFYDIPSPDYDGDIYLDWSTVQATSYKVYMRIQGDIDWGSPITTTGITSSYFYEAGLSNGVYEFTVKAYNYIGSSPYSNIESVEVILEEEPPPPPPPEPPETPFLNIIDPPTDDDGDVYLDWDPSERAVYYEIQQSINGGSWFVLESYYIGTDYTDSGLDNGNYQYRVKARNDEGESGWSDIRSVTVEIYVPPILYPPTNPEISINDGDDTTDSFIVSLTLSCENADTMKFQISIDEELGDWTIPVPYGESKQLTLPQASDGTIYEITVMFLNDYGDIEASDSIIYTTEENGNGEEDDYTITYILVGVLVGIFVVAIVIIINKKKRRSKKTKL